MAKNNHSTSNVILSLLPGLSRVMALIGAIAITILVILPATVGTARALESYEPVPLMIRDHNPKTGKLDSNVIVMEFLDFQCPGCRAAHPVITQIKQEYGDRVMFVDKMFPLAIHANAQISAEGALAADKQGKYAEYADKLFAYQDNPGLNSRTQTRIAEEIGLDMEKWDFDRKSREIEQQMLWDMEDGRRAVLPISDGSDITESVTATPTFVFIKDGKIRYKTSGMSATEFRSELDSLLGDESGAKNSAEANSEANSEGNIAPGNTSTSVTESNATQSNTTVESESAENQNP